MLALGFGAAHDDLGELGAPCLELRLRELELRPQRLIVELREQLAFLDDHAFLDRAPPQSCP